MLYEFLCFKLPFGEDTDGDPYSVYSSIKKTGLSFPKFVRDGDIKKLIVRLLEKDPRKRGEITFDKIKKSEFFKNFDWNSLLEDQMKGPYIPREFRNNQLE